MDTCPHLATIGSLLPPLSTGEDTNMVLGALNVFFAGAQVYAHSELKWENYKTQFDLIKWRASLEQNSA